VKSNGARVTVRARAFSDRQVQVITLPMNILSRAMRARVRTVISNSIRVICETQLPTNFFSRLESELRPRCDRLNLARLYRRICGSMAETGLN